MHPRTVDFLLRLNRQFYQTFALQFAQTRQRLQPGVRRILPDLLGSGSILDLGCGNGELARELGSQGFEGAYLGLDFSAELLEQARRQPTAGTDIRFLQVDLTDAGWDSALLGAVFERITAFAVLHHIPGQELRLGLLKQARRHLTPEGRILLSNWQFLNSARWRSRIQDWNAVGLAATDLEEGDYLLDWRHGGEGLRYVHHFQEGELRDLAAACSFTVMDTFWSDGKGGRLGLYQVWKPV